MNIFSEKDLNTQLEKYCCVEKIKLRKDKETCADSIHQNSVFVLDVNGLYIYDNETKTMRVIEKLDNIKCEHDIRKLRNTIKSILEV